VSRRFPFIATEELKIVTIDDFTLLGWTEPHPTKRNGNCICAAGYSRQLDSFLRIYPVPYPFHADIRRWDVLCFPVIRNPKDNRTESWKIGYLDRDRDALARLITKVGRTTPGRERHWLESHCSDSIEQLNSEKRSLGFIRASELTPGFRQRMIDPQMTTDSLFWEDNAKLQQNSWIPELQFKNVDGTFNTIQLLEWGCAEFLRKNPFSHEKLWQALLIGRPDYRHFLFIGNNNRHRTTWLGIALLWEPVTRYAQSELF
jgi:hypothetical protein